MPRKLRPDQITVTPIGPVEVVIGPRFDAGVARLLPWLDQLCDHIEEQAAAHSDQPEQHPTSDSEAM
jgi:hypothetical protein